VGENMREGGEGLHNCQSGEEGGYMPVNVGLLNKNLKKEN